MHEHVAAVLLVLERSFGAIEPGGAVLVSQPRDWLATSAACFVNTGCLPPPFARSVACRSASVTDEQAPVDGGNQEI